MGSQMEEAGEVRTLLGGRRGQLASGHLSPAEPPAVRCKGQELEPMPAYADLLLRGTLGEKPAL